ncbi:MAG: hypothetical protein KF901_10195 [Myxococcales bacterium]|nr:hypothetical protein [Myxococcales bacterium]
MTMRSDPRRAAVLTALLVACGSGERTAPTPEPPAPPADPLAGLEAWSNDWVLAHAPRYLEDPAARRAALEASLTNHENLYSQTRLGAYGHGRRGWDSLPEWRPRVRAIDAELATKLASGERPSLDETPAFGEGERPSRWDEWVTLGRRVFYELPLRSEPFWQAALTDASRAEALGVERGPDGSFPGLVWMRDVDGRDTVGITCALCHVARAPVGDALVEGRARRRLDYGQARVAYYEGRGQAIEDEVRARWESWGPGRADVLEDVADVPVAIPDLWGLRDQRLLTQAGTLKHHDPLALAIRQETQYIQANHHQTRPPRELMFALTLYLYSITPPPARPFDGRTNDRLRGAMLFTDHCARCHSNAVAGGDELVPLDEIGTDPELASGGARGTGGYRPAPLLRIADAGPYLHHGSVASLEELLSGDREEPGHRFGVDLDEHERALLLAYLMSR